VAAIDRSFVDANREQLDRMRGLAERLTDDELRTPMSDGWTVGAVLGHLAYWDQRVLVLLDMQDRGLDPPAYDEASVDWINDTAKPFLVAMEPRSLARLAVEIAGETDRRIADLSDERLEQATARWFTPRRWEDRKEHMDEIDQALAGAKA
jgi:hypothetical protein